MNIKWCPRPSKVTHFRQSEKAAFYIYGLSSGITTHFQPKFFLSYANSKCVSQGSFTELVAALQSLSCSPQGCALLKIPLHLLFPLGETNPLEQFFILFWFHSMHSSNLHWGATAQAPGKARSSSKARCVPLDLVQQSSPGTQLCLCEHHTVQHFKTWSSNSKRHSIYLLIVANF